MRKIIPIIATIFFASFISGAIVFFSLKVLNPHSSPIGYIYGMAMYPDEHPLQYIALFCFFFALCTTLWIARMNKEKYIGLQIAAVILISLLISCAFAGILWNVHDMRAGYFPRFEIMMNTFWSHGILWGIMLGPIVILTSLPLNLIGFIIAYLIAYKVQKVFSLQSTITPRPKSSSQIP